MSTLSKNNFAFLNALRENNNKAWFDENRPTYELMKDEVAIFADEVLRILNKKDVIETISGKKSMFRIFKDVRFSKDKSPYKQNWSGYYRRATTSRRGGYYYHIEPGNTYISGGFFSPNKEDLLHFRKQLEVDAQPLREILDKKEFKTYFGNLEGTQLKTSPKGFDKEADNIDLLRYKSYHVTHYFTDKEVLSDDFAKKMADGLVKLLPFFDVMTNYLLTDLNGEDI